MTMRSELMAAALAVILGDERARETITEKALALIEKDVLGPAREWQREHDDVRPLHFGRKVRDYIERSERGGSLAGMALALLELVLRKEREITALKESPAEASALDWAAVRAERDDLRAKLAKRDRDLASVETSRNVEASNAVSLGRSLREANVNMAEMTERLRIAEARNRNQAATIEQMEAELTAAKDRAARLPELEATILRMDQDLTAAEGLRQAAEDKIAEARLADDPRGKEKW